MTPNDYRLYPDLDEIYTEQGDTSARTALFQNAPPAVLDQDTVRARRALLFLDQGKYDDAMALFTNHTYKPWEGGVVMHNMFVFTNIEEGKQQLQNHHPDAAEASFRKALEYPDNLGTGATRSARHCGADVLDRQRAPSPGQDRRSQSRMAEIR